MDSVHDAYLRILAAVARRAQKTLGDIESPHIPPVLSPVVADTPLPPFDRVAMDGIAICLAAVSDAMPGIDGKRAFRREGMQPAGAPPLTLKDSENGCIEVMTGAMLPKGCDTVINYERLEATADGFIYHQGEQLNEWSVGDNVHHKGSDYPQDHPLLPQGAITTGPVAGLLASVGATHFQAPYIPKVAIVATGDELVPVTATPEPHQIRRSNSYALKQLLADHGFKAVTCHHLADAPEAIAAFLQETPADVVVFSGGVSKGRKDYIPEVITSCDGEILVHGVSQRPGKPLLFATRTLTRTENQLIFGLPGNPVSTLVCGLRYLIPALHKMAGTDRWPGLWGAPVRLAEDFRFGKPLTRFVPVTLTVSAAATLEGHPIAIGGSGDFASLSHSDGVLELPAEPSDFAAGGIYPYYGWLPLPLMAKGAGK